MMPFINVFFGNRGDGFPPACHAALMLYQQLIFICDPSQSMTRQRFL